MLDHPNPCNQAGPARRTSVYMNSTDISARQTHSTHLFTFHVNALNGFSSASTTWVSPDIKLGNLSACVISCRDCQPKGENVEQYKNTFFSHYLQENHRGFQTTPTTSHLCSSTSLRAAVMLLGVLKGQSIKISSTRPQKSCYSCFAALTTEQHTTSSLLFFFYTSHATHG